MNHMLLNASRRVETMVARQDELDTIKQSIYLCPDEQCCRVVLVLGPGGIGKSRLLEEIQWRTGYPRAREATQHTVQQSPSREDWTLLGSVTVSDVIDLIDIRLSARTQLLQALRNALSGPGGVDFSGYEKAMRAHLRALENSASFSIIKSRADEAESAFWQAFKDHTEKQRIVLILDTAERLILRSSDWLIQRNLLEPDELIISSQQWFLEQIRAGHFSNTTLIIAGRDGEHEGKPFFDQVRSVVKNPTTPCDLEEIKLDALSEDETAVYFQYLAEEWQGRVSTLQEKTKSSGGEAARISRSMQGMAGDSERLSVLHQVTGGRPVLLSLYGDLIHEIDTFPDLLRLGSQEVKQMLDERGEQSLQAEVERSYIGLLFRQPGLRSEIMQTLARCPAGLSAEQIHFVIDSNGETDPSNWKPNQDRLEEISVHLDQIRLLSVARPRPNGRLGLQDEIYRIYAERMGETDDLRNYEHAERIDQYEKLSRWASWKFQKDHESLRDYQAEDERRLVAAIRLPTMALRPYIPSPPPSEQDARIRIQQTIRDWELEKLHYDLLRNPADGLNDAYTDLAERRWHTNDEEADFITQQEMWRVLYDNHALKFTDLSKERLKALRRLAVEEDLARWIKRFILRRDYGRAITFFNSVESAILQEPERATWQHPLNSGERIIWKNYANIMLGTNVLGAVEQLKATLTVLIELAQAPKDKSVGPAGETGFQGHPGLPRLYRIIAVGYNFAGYGYVVLGQYLEAVENYGRALKSMREIKFEAQQAATRNNLGRALASLGREERGYRVCADGLDLRRKLGAEIPIAYSLNTLALIDNSMQRTPTAWRKAAQAAAIFRRAGDDRGLGLALIQFGMGLRRLANSSEPGVVLEATPEELYVTAEDAIGEAVDIFTKDPEVLRLVEARLQLGCVLRDRMRLIDPKSAPDQLPNLHRDTEIELNRTIDLAKEHGFVYLAVKTRVNLAWAHFLARDFIKAEKEGLTAEKEIPNSYKMTTESAPTSLKTPETHYFYQLRKIQALYAAIAMERFIDRREELRLQHSSAENMYEQLKQDKEAREYLGQATEGYVLSLFYGQMFSPRSMSLATTYDQIYQHVKSFNMVEYSMFYEEQQSAAKKYRGLNEKDVRDQYSVQPYDFSNLEDWLIDSFGPLKVSDE